MKKVILSTLFMFFAAFGAGSASTSSGSSNENGMDNKTETQCLTIATFAPFVKEIVQFKDYVTALGRFALGASFDERWTIYVFPYRFDDVVNGKSVRQWIFDLRNLSF